MTEDNIGIIVLAAGSGKRFGADKRKARMKDGRSLLETTLSSIPDTIPHRILVLKAGDEELATAHPDWQIATANDPDSGMANSLSCGISLAAHWDGALIALADMPYIQPATYSQIRTALLEHEIVIPCYQGQRGNPVAFRNKYFEEIKSLSGDQGARSLLQRYAASCHALELADAGIIRDVDNPESLE